MKATSCTNLAVGMDQVRSNEGGNTIGEGVEGITGVVNVSGEVEATAGGDLAEEGQLTDATVLRRRSR